LISVFSHICGDILLDFFSFFRSFVVTVLLVMLLGSGKCSLQDVALCLSLALDFLSVLEVSDDLVLLVLDLLLDGLKFLFSVLLFWNVNL
jgi:hypothetical protein